MYEFTIPDMSCGHCVSTVRKAILETDANATADIDLASHTAKVETSAEITRLVAALDEAGYPATVRQI